MGERKRGRGTSMWERNIPTLDQTCNPGVSWPEIKPVTLPFVGRCSTNCTTPIRGLHLLFKLYIPLRVGDGGTMFFTSNFILRPISSFLSQIILFLVRCKGRGSLLSHTYYNWNSHSHWKYTQKGISWLDRVRNRLWNSVRCFVRKHT